MLGGREVLLSVAQGLFQYGKKRDSKLPEEKLCWSWGPNRAALYNSLLFICTEISE